MASSRLAHFPVSGAPGSGKTTLTKAQGLPTYAVGKVSSVEAVKEPTSESASRNFITMTPLSTESACGLCAWRGR